MEDDEFYIITSGPGVFHSRAAEQVRGCSE